MKNRIAIISFLMFFCSSSICLDASEESFRRVFRGLVIRRGAGAKIAGIISGSGITWEEFRRFSSEDPDLQQKIAQINRAFWANTKCAFTTEICLAIQKKRDIAQQFRTRIMRMLLMMIGNTQYRPGEPADDGIPFEQFMQIQYWVNVLSCEEDPFRFMASAGGNLDYISDMLPQSVRDYITGTIDAYRENRELPVLPAIGVPIVYLDQFAQPPAPRPLPASSEPDEFGGADDDVPPDGPAGFDTDDVPPPDEPVEFVGANDDIPSALLPESSEPVELVGANDMPPDSSLASSEPVEFVGAGSIPPALLPESSEPVELVGANDMPPALLPESSEPVELVGANDMPPDPRSPLADDVSTGTGYVSPNPVPESGPQRRKRRHDPEIREIPPVPSSPKVNMDPLKVRGGRTASNNLSLHPVPGPGPQRRKRRSDRGIQEEIRPVPVPRKVNMGPQKVRKGRTANSNLRIRNSVSFRGNGALSSSKDRHVWYSGGAAGSDKHRERRHFPNNEYTGIMYRSPGLVLKTTSR